MFILVLMTHSFSRLCMPIYDYLVCAFFVWCIFTVFHVLFSLIPHILATLYKILVAPQALKVLWVFVSTPIL